MKRLTVISMMILCLVSFSSLAEDLSEPLFPAVGGNGKWGYMDREGTFVIPHSLTVLRISEAIMR